MGVADGKYINFRDLNKRVVKPSIGEVNEHSPISVEPEFKKQGRAVVAIRFLINRQANLPTSIQVKPNIAERTIIERLQEDYGLSPKQLENTLNQYSDAYMLEKMAVIESSSSYQSGQIKHLAKYLEKALVENYQPPKSSKDNLEKIQVQREKEVENRTKHEDDMQKYRAYQNKALPSIFNGLPEKERVAVEKAFDKYISSTLYYSIYIKDGFNNPLVSDRFGDFVRANHLDILSSLLSFDVFCEEKLTV